MHCKNMTGNSSLLLPNELCLEIISLQIHSDSISSLDDFPAGIGKLFNSLSFPQLQSNDLKTISKEISSLKTQTQKTKDSFIDILKSHRYNPPFDSDYLLLIQSNIDKLDQNHASFIVVTVLIMYIAWCIKYQNINQFDDLKLIYQLLIEFANKMSLKNNFTNYTSHLCFLIVSAAHICILTYLNSESANISTKEVIQILQNFYSLHFSFPPNAFDIIEIALNYAIHLNDSNTQNVKELYAYIGIICEEKKSSFPSSIAQKIADDLTLLFSQLDLPALTLYLHLSKHLTIDSNCQIFNLFGNSIWQIILQQEEPFIKTKPNSINDFTQEDEKMTEIEDFNSTPTAEVAFRFYDEDRFVNGVNLKTNFIFPDPISILELLTEDLKTALDLISSIASNQEELILILFETLAGIIQSFSKEKEDENKEKHRWDINIVFLYFCKRFYKYIRKKECEILLSQPFFNPKKTVFDNIGNEEFQFISSVRTIVMITLLNSPKGLIEVALYHWMNYPFLFAEIIHRIIANIIYNNKNNPSTYNIDQKNFNGFCRSLKISSLHFQHLHYTIKDDKLIDSIEIARTSILLLISTLFTFPFEIVNMLWSNIYFVPFFLSFLFEVPLRSFILSSLLSYLSKQQNDVPKILLNTLQQIMNICFPFFPNDKFVILITDITSTLNEAFLHQRSLTSKFQPFCSLFFDSFRSVIKTEPMKNYILQCIQFFSIVATLNELGTVQYAALEESILNAFENDIPQQLTNKLIQLIAGDSLASLTPTFIICHPKAVELFVHVSLNNTKLVEVIDFIKSLVEFSIINANLLRKYNFDIYLIDCIKNSNDKEIIDSFLNLFLQIAVSISSISVVQKYISLLSPFEGKYYSDFQEKYISTLNNIIVTSMKYPVGALKMNNHDGSVEIIGMNQSEFTNGFTFVCWVQLDAFQDAKYIPNLLFIQDSKGNKISIFISAFNLYCKQATTSYESTGKAEFPIPKGRWSFISVTFSHNSDTSFMTPYYGTKEMKSLEYVVMNFQPGPMKCKIAGITRDSLPSSGYEARMSAFGLFPPLDKELLDSICQIGPRGAGYIPVKPICFFAPDADNSGFLILKPRHTVSTGISSQHSKFYHSEFQTGISLNSSSFSSSSSHLLIQNKGDESLSLNPSLLEDIPAISSSQSLFFEHNIYAVFVKNKNGNNNNNNNNQIACDPTFSQLLMQYCKIDILLPLFDQFSMTMKNGNSFPNRKLTIDLFKNLLSSSIQVQKSFYNTKGINIISSLLYSNMMKNEEIIDYPLYLQFFSLTQIISYDPLIESIIKDILLDVELWMHADAENHLRIIRHWDRTLFPSMLSYVSDLFQRILYIMRVYYWYEYVIEEQELIKCKRRTRNEKLNVTECRQLLLSIAALISTQRFSKDDINCIISHCLSCVEHQQVIDLLMLIRNIGLTDPSPLCNLTKNINFNLSNVNNNNSSNSDLLNNDHDNRNDGSEFISFLYSLLPRRNYLIFILIFEVTIVFYKCQLIQTPCLQDQIMLFMNQLSPSKITPDLFFRGVESIKNGFYEMFPVCCWIAINESVTENHILLMLDQIAPSPNFVTHQTWSFWPIVLCFLANSFLIPYRILGFIVSCDYKVWTHEYAMIHDVGLILTKESEKIKSLFLHCVAKIIEDDPNIQIDAVSSFFYMAKKYLLFKRKEESNERLLYLFYNESPFSNQSEEEPSVSFDENAFKNSNTEKLSKNGSAEKLFKNSSDEKLVKNSSAEKLFKNSSDEKLVKNSSDDKLIKENDDNDNDNDINVKGNSHDSVAYVEIEDESESVEENEIEIENNFEYNLDRRFSTSFDNYNNNSNRIQDEEDIQIDENDENNGECIMVDDDLCENNYYCSVKKNNFVKSLTPRVMRSRTAFGHPPLPFESAPIAIDPNPNSNKYSKTRNKSNDDNDKGDNDFSTHDLSLNMKININLRLKAILNKISYKNELDRFGIRFDDQGNMTDRELAEITIGIFNKFPLKSFLDFDLILCSFLLHRIPNVIIEHIKKLSTAITKGNLSSTFQSSIDLFIHHCSLMQIKFDPPLFKSSSNYLKNAFTLLEKLSCSSPIDDNLITIAKHIFIIIKDEFSDLSIQKVAQNLGNQNLDDLINNNRNQILNSIELEKTIKKQNKHFWSHLWRSLEIDPAPWSVNLGYKTHFKRDTTACSFGCPFKLKRNWEFNDYMKKEGGENQMNENDKNEEENINSEKLIEISFDLDSSSNYDNKKIIYSIPCIIVKATKTKSATFSLFKNRIELNSNNGGHLISIYLNEIRKIYFRNYKGKPTAFELFTLMKKSYFINFPNHKSMQILKSIKSIGAPNAKFIQTANFNIFVNQVDKKVLWQHNRISNFNYLMHLNKVSGRTFNDISQYPIFPWILCEMILKLTEQEEEEDSNKEVIKNQAKIEKLNSLVAEFKDKKDEFHFDSLSSILNSFKISDFLLRVEPFTSMFIKMQNNEFKGHDLMFKSITDLFSLSTSLDNDFCFLPPEFFFDFEFLKNSNKFEFGVNDVQLPEWTNQDHFYFIYMMRKALESDIVSQNLNQWIDIVWGSSQSKSDTFSSFKAFAPKMESFEVGGFNNISNNNQESRRRNRSIAQRSRMPRISKPSSMSKLSFIPRSSASSFLNMNLNSESEHNVDDFDDDDDEENYYSVANENVKGTMKIDESKSTDNLIFRSLNLGFKETNTSIELHSARSGSILDSSSSSSSNSSLNLKAKITKLSSFPPQLFSKPHPRRNVNEITSRPIKCVISIPPTKIKVVSLAEFENPREWSFKVVEIGKNGLIVTHVIDFTKRQQKQRIAFCSQPILAKSASDSDNSASNSSSSASKGKEMEGIELHFSTKEMNSFKEIGVDIFARNNSASQIGLSIIAFVSHKTNKLFIADPEKGNVEEIMSNVTGISTYKDFFAVSRSDEALSIYKGSFSQSNFMFNLSSFGDTIKCSCINKRFFVAIVGTRGGKLIVYSLNKGAIVNTIDLNGAQPFLVTVTKSWGFIVCYCQKVKNGVLKHLLLIFSINGKLIRKVKINFEIVVWTSWTSNKSFDYMAVADKNGKLFAFEVFFGKLGETIHRCISRIVTMTYIQDLSCIATVTEDGCILFVPYETNS